MRKYTGFLLVALILSAIAWLATGCLGERELSGAGRAAVLAYSEAITDNMLAGLAANDYATFSRDFDDYVQRIFPAADFAAWKGIMDDKIGTYISREVVRVHQSDEFRVVDYRARFEQDEQVIITVAFHAVEPHLIGGLWFEAEKLGQE